ncbi:MAG TPA: polyphosphate kinase 1 [Gemmatimonadales bacterium]|nr:polyphosphate kinase 1 [Gemmatimonadales bacterium]
MTLRWDVPVAALLGQLIEHPPVSGVTLSTPLVTSFRDTYCDTPDGDLRQRGARYRFRFTTDGKRRVTLWLPDGARFESEDAEARVRGLADPARLTSWTEIEVTRRARVAQVPVLRLPLCNLIADTISARRAELNAQLWEFALQPRGWGGGGIAARLIARKIAALPLRPVGEGVRLHRAQAALEDAEGRALARELRGERALALIAVEHGRLGLCRLGAELRIPVDIGTGETACRAALRRLVGNGEGQVRLLAVVPPVGERPPLEVWTVRRIHTNPALQWFTPRELLDRVGSPVLRDPTSLAALTVAARSPLIPEWSGAAFDDPAADVAPEDVARASRATLSELRVPVLAPDQLDPARAAPEQFLNPELSWIEFNARVLALAEDPRTPPAARLRFLGIFSTNLDYFVATKVGALKQLAALKRAGPSGDGLRPQETLDAIAIRLRPLLARQYRLFHALLRSGPENLGVAVVHWPELTPEEQASARTRFADAVLPYLSPKALTRAPGHPFPHVADRRIVLLVVLRDRADAPPHYALVEMPDALPRFEVFSAGRRLLPLEDLVRANLERLYPGRIVVGAHAFRVTRSGDLQLDESSTANFLQAIEEELTRRLLQPVVRIEIESGTPAPLQDLLQREIHLEEGERAGGVAEGPADVYAADELVDLGALRDVPAPLADYPAQAAREPFVAGRSVAEQLDEHDVLVHHPYDSFTASFERFITEAADDPDVQAIKLTLYRPGGGGPSAIANALRRAAAAGKDVSVIVEVKARFDEAHNIAWARSLQRDGIHVVTGLVSLKTHAKIALVVRRVRGRVRRYAHIGSGNYNPDTALAYADVGLFTTHPRITEDLHTLFNELTGSTSPPRGALRHLLVAPADLLDRLLAMIARETAHARAGRPARIRAKLNGLADSTVVQALYEASQAGVDIDLVVRGICTLRPGLPGLSERIRVVSKLGRYLEHSRIYHFGNGGDDAEEYYIGSADWRPRNLRRRVEVMAPVLDPAARRMLDDLLTNEVADPAAWVLQSDGRYDRL